MLIQYIGRYSVVICYYMLSDMYTFELAIRVYLQYIHILFLNVSSGKSPTIKGKKSNLFNRNFFFYDSLANFDPKN